MTQIIQRLHAVYINANTLFSEKGSKLGISPSVLMAGYIKRYDPHMAEFLECFIDRSTVLILFLLFFHITYPLAKIMFWSNTF